jgi:type IV secretory pathway VirB10-like protein
MSFDHEPPRLRTLQRHLPRELSLVLEDTHADDATSAELAALDQRVKRALHANERERTQVRSPYPPAKRSRVAAVVFTFAIGAAAGVAGSSAVFYAISPSTPPSTPASTASQRPPRARLALPPAKSAEPPAAPEPPTDEEPAPVGSSAPRGSAQSPVKSSTVESSPEPSNRPAAGSREEFALIARAQGVLAGNPGLALALTSDHERNFPNGVLIQERELVAIDALLRLGRRAEATARAAHFHRHFPTSVHGRRIDVLLGNGGTSGASR